MAETQVYRRKVQVKSEHGLHIRPCTVLAQAAMRFQSRIRLGMPGRHVDAKSILDLMTLAAAPGSELELEVEGGDAAEALEQMAALFDTNFAPPAPATNGQPSPTQAASIS